MDKLKTCPFCDGKATLIDHRTDWFVKCDRCNVVVYGETVNHLDHIEDDLEAQKAFDAVDWDYLKQTAVDKWNTRVSQSKWISVTDNLPVQSQSNRYLSLNLVLAGRTVVQGGFNDGLFWLDGVRIDNVTHWQPLPSPPN